MPQTKKAAPSQSSPSQETNSTNCSIAGKLDGMLWHFATGAKLHRFMAEKLGDHVLPSTVSSLQSRHGIYFDRKRIKVPNRFGTETSVCLYWLSGDHLDKARQLIGVKEAA